MSSDELERFHRGEETTFCALVETHSPRLLAIAGGFASSRADAHDLVQETWVRAYAKRRSFEGRGPLLAWLCAICRNVCVSRSRTGARGEWMSPSSGRAGGQTDATGAGWRAPSPMRPDAALETAEIGRAVRTALLELPDRQRVVVIYRLLEDRTTRETAELLGCAEGTVKATLHHALANLERHLGAWKPEG